MIDFQLRPDAFFAGHGRKRRWVETGLQLLMVDGKCAGYRASHEGAPFCFTVPISDAVKSIIRKEYGNDAWIVEPSAKHSQWPKRRPPRRGSRRRIIIPEHYR